MRLESLPTWTVVALFVAAGWIQFARPDAVANHSKAAVRHLPFLLAGLGLAILVVAYIASS